MNEELLETLKALQESIMEIDWRVEVLERRMKEVDEIGKEYEKMFDEEKEKINEKAHRRHRRTD
jgi:hypothetical protein